MFILLLIAFSEADDCPVYKCKKSSQKFDSNTCVYYNEDSSTYYAQKCSSAATSYCNITEGANSTCIPSPAPAKRYPSEKCTSSSDCYSNVCTKNRCVGAVFASPCSTDYDCNLGLYCSSAGLCAHQLKANEKGCFTDFQCENTAGCNITSESVDGGTCIGYFNISYLENVGTCVNNQSQLCEYGYCVSYKESNICFGEAIHDIVSPYTCDTKTCRTYKDPNIDDIYLPGICSCGLNPDKVKVCNLFYQDQEGQSYFSLWNDWATGDTVMKCHTNARSIDHINCMKEYWSDFVEFMYKYYKFSTYSQHYFADTCVLEVFLPNYYDYKKEDLAAITILGISILILF